MAARTPGSFEPAAKVAAGVVLLIVEDEILSAMSLRDALLDAGYEVLDLTGRHQEALLAARACKPDLALVNIKLDAGDDGIALARDLKVMGIPVLFISGQVNRARTATTVAVGSLPKPYDAADMVRAVAYLLRHMKGDDTLKRPFSLEVFDQAIDDMAPDPV
jgi:DNA-binding response OmpR family regulator